MGLRSEKGLRKILASGVLAICVAAAVSMGATARQSEAVVNSPADFRALLPSDNGRFDTIALCSSCHDVSRIVTQHKERRAWGATVDRMVGMSASEDQIEVILDYLTKHFGPENPLTVLPMNLNTAEPEAIARLPGITEDQVGMILKMRSERDIRTASDLGEVMDLPTLEEIRPFIVFK